MEELQEKLNIVLDPETKEVVIRHGDAKKVYDEEIVTLSGIITTASTYLENRRKLCKPENCHVTFSKYERSIVFVVNEDSKFKSTITGTLKRNKFLNELNINNAKSYTISSLRDAFRFGKRFFSDPSEHAAFIKRLENFTATITATTSRENDNQGNKKESFESRVTKFTEDNPLSVTLNLPIFEGANPEKLKLEILIDVVNGAVVLFLVCENLEELEDNLLETAFDEERKKFEGYVIVDK